MITTRCPRRCEPTPDIAASQFAVSTRNRITKYELFLPQVDQDVLDQIEQLLKVHAAELKQKGNSEKDKSDKVRTSTISE